MYSNKYRQARILELGMENLGPPIAFRIGSTGPWSSHTLALANLLNEDSAAS